MGPTASGKSSLGVQMAQKFNGLIISADSRQVYKEMNIGTAKITKKEMKGVPHFLIDIVSPKNYYSAALFRKESLEVINKYHNKKNIFVVGGSPFYIESIISPKETFNIPPDKELRKKLSKFSTDQLFNKLKKINPKTAKTIDKNNPRRLIRAIEITKSKNKKIKEEIPKFKTLKIGISLPREKLYQLIDKRVDLRFKKGMINEVKKLKKQGLTWKRLDSFGLEYRYISKYLRNELKKEDMAEQLKFAIHDFVRRQMTWFRKDKSIHWIKSLKQAEDLIRKFL